MPLEDDLLPEQFMTHDEVVSRYKKTGESRYAVGPTLGKARAIFRKLGYKNIKQIRTYESDTDIIILYVDQSTNREAIIGCLNPSLNFIVMSKPERQLMWLTMGPEKV